jgi:pimeloyl-ACP methyl ester carboxylesterase
LDVSARLIETPLGPVEYAESGSGPPLLSFHGTPGGFDGALLAAELHCGPGFRIIGFSRPGYLRTPLSSGPAVPQQADLAAALLDALAIPEALVYGLSGGGPFALAFAARHPGRCRALVLGSAVTAPDPRSNARLDLEIKLLSLLDFGAPVFRALPARREFVRILNVIVPFARRAAGYRNDATVFGNFTPIELERIACPTLIVHGTSDASASFPNARAAAAKIPHCETLFVKRAGHVSVWSRPGVRQRVAEFLRGSSVQ